MPSAFDASARKLQEVAESGGLATNPGLCAVHGECDMILPSYFHSMGFRPFGGVLLVAQFKMASCPRNTKTFCGVFVNAPSVSDNTQCTFSYQYAQEKVVYLFLGRTSRMLCVDVSRFQYGNGTTLESLLSHSE